MGTIPPPPEVGPTRTDYNDIIDLENLNISNHQCAVVACRDDADTAMRDVYARLSDGAKHCFTTATAAYTRFRVCNKEATDKTAYELAGCASHEQGLAEADIEAGEELFNTWLTAFHDSVSSKDIAASDPSEEKRFHARRIVDAKMEALNCLRKHRVEPEGDDAKALAEKAGAEELKAKRFKGEIEGDGKEERPAAAKDPNAKYRDKVMSTLQDPRGLQDYSIDSLIGQDGVREFLRDVIFQFRQPQTDLGQDTPLLLFEGASGSGKGLAVKILAKEIGCALFKPELRLFDGAAGLKLLEAFFDIVKEYAKAEDRNCIVFLDEADGILSKPNKAKIPVFKWVLQAEDIYYRIIPVIATNHPLKITDDEGMASRLCNRVTFQPLSRDAKQKLIENVFEGLADNELLSMKEADWPIFFDSVNEENINGHTIRALCGNAVRRRQRLVGEWEEAYDAAREAGNDAEVARLDTLEAQGIYEVGLKELQAVFGAKAGDGTPKPTKADVIAKLQERFVLDSRTVKDGAIFLFEDVVQKVLENRHLKALGATEQQLALLRGDKGRDKLSKMDGVRNALQECVKEAFGLTVFAFAHKNDWIAHAALVQYENGETTELYVEVHPPKKMNRWCSTKLWYKDATKPDDHKAAKLDTAKRTILQRVLGRALDDSLWDNLSSHLEEYYSIETIQKLAAKARENANGAAITFEHFGLKTDELSSEQLTEFSGALWQRYCIGPLVQRNYRDADNCPAFEYPDGYYRIADFDLYNGYYAPITTLDDFYQRMPVSVLKALSPTGLVLLPTKRNSFVAMKRLNSALRSIFTNQRNRLPELQGSVIWHLKERDAPLPNPTPYPFTGTSPQDLSALWILPHQSNYDKNALIAARSYQDIEIAGFY